MLASNGSLRGRTAWITGASRGIGRAVALAFARAGAHVLVGARTAQQLDTIVEILRQEGHSATALPLDVSSWESCQDFARGALDQAGNPDLLVNNAGIGVFRPVDKFEEDEFERQFRVNVFGTFYMTRLAVPRMKELGGGHIFNVSSMAGESEAKMGCGYFASKHAVHGFTKCLLQDVREDGIRVTLVCPGSVDTRFHHESHPGSHPKDQSWMVTPEQVAESILHVATMAEPALVSRLEIRPSRLPGQRSSH